MKIIAAVCNIHFPKQVFRGGIGLKDALPWKINKDLQYFKEITIGSGKNAVVMGRKTWESLPKALPKRDNLVLSTTVNPEKNMTRFYSIGDLERHIERKKYDDVWIIGGSTIYNQFRNKVSKMYITNIDKNYICDSFFLEGGDPDDSFSMIATSATYEENGTNFQFQVFTNHKVDYPK